MGHYAYEDILGLHFNDGRVTCRECATDKELEEVKENEILVEDDGAVAFCDRCHKKI